MPTSTKNMSTMVDITGRCDGLDDPVFYFGTKSNTAYEVKVNFACSLNFNNSAARLVGLNMVVTYQVTPKLGKYLDFTLTAISGTPLFVESGSFKI